MKIHQVNKFTITLYFSYFPSYFMQALYIYLPSNNDMKYILHTLNSELTQIVTSCGSIGVDRNVLITTFVSRVHEKGGTGEYVSVLGKT